MTITQARILFLVMMLLYIPVIVSGVNMLTEGDWAGILNIVIGVAIWGMGIYMMLPRVKLFRSKK